MSRSTAKDGPLNASLALHRLPNEILCKIFLEYLPDGGSQISVGSFNGTTITLSQVCSRWRDVVLGDPRLWSQLSLHLKGKSWQEKHSWNQVNQFGLDWFSKAKDRPLRLQFGYQPKLVGRGRIIEVGCDFGKFLAPLMERIQDLELAICRLPQHLSAIPPNNFLQLESIVLYRASFEQTTVETTWDPEYKGPLTIFRNAPRLRRLSMYFPLFGNSIDSVLIPWFQLTHLIISYYMYPTAWEELLPRCTNLTHGVFCIESDYSLISSRPKTTLAHLVELTVICYGAGMIPALLRNFHLPKLQTLRLGPLDIEEIFLKDKIYLFPHLSLVRRLSFQSYIYWRHVESDHLLAIELLKFAENVEEFDISSNGDYSTIVKGLIISDGVSDAIALPKLKSMSIHFESWSDLSLLHNFSVTTLRDMVDSRWHLRRTHTRLCKICIFLTQSDITEALAGNLKKSLEDELGGYISEGLTLDISFSGRRDVHWQDRLPHDENYWKEGMNVFRDHLDF